MNNIVFLGSSGLVLIAGVLLLVIVAVTKAQKLVDSASRLAGEMPEVVERGGCEYCRPEMYPKRGE